MDPRYLNAVAVLPPDVLQAVTKALGGRAAFLWVPAHKNVNRADRDGYVLRLRDEGLTVSDIAMKLFVSERTVWRILERERAHRAPSGRATRGRRQ